MRRRGSDHSGTSGASELRAAATLNRVGYNVARAVGPALGGIIVAIWDRDRYSF